MKKSELKIINKAKIGDKFELNGTVLECVEFDDNNCWGCFFNKELTLDCEIKCGLDNHEIEVMYVESKLKLK